MKEEKNNKNAKIDTNFAPVIIPTLNRYSHFKRCFESLEKCTGAEHTDVYIGLDYPPSEKYFEGWEKIDAYLKDKELSNGFKNLFVRRRDSNCGVCNSSSNARLLYTEVKTISDRCIFSEDDNEFSENFLEYMNYCLNRFSNDNKVMSICGYCFPETIIEHDDQWFKAHFSNGWGIAIWFNKRFKYSLEGKKNYLNEILYSWKLSYRLFSRRALSLNNMISMHFSGQYYGDVFKTAEMILDNKYSIFPSVSKVRNWGNDGSGQHCLASELYSTQDIDTKKHFTVPPKDPILIDVKESIRYKNVKKIFIACRYLLFRAFNFDLLKVSKLAR